MKRHVLSMSELLQQHICACLSRTFFHGSDLKGGKVARVDLSDAEAGVKKALAPRWKRTALDRVEAARSSLEKYFALNASIERVFRDFSRRFKSGPAHIIMVELVARLNPPKFETKVATALGMKVCWKEHPDLVYSVARKTAEAWATVEQADKLRRVQSRPKDAGTRVGSAKEEKGAVVGRSGQESSTCSGDSKPRGSCWNCGKDGHRMADYTTKRKSGSPGGRISSMVRLLCSSPLFLQRFKQGADPALC